MNALQPAYLLHRRPYRESSLLVELLTAEAGRIGLMARGQRGGRRRQRNELAFFSPSLVAWRGRGELPQLTHCETLGQPRHLEGHALIAAMYVNELVMYLTARGDPHPELFVSYEQLLDALFHARKVEIAPLLRRFELNLLELLGYGLALQGDIRTGVEIQPERSYCYLFEQGPMEGGGDCRNGTLVRGETLLALRQGDWQRESTQDEMKRFMRTVLNFHLGGRKLKSRELFYAKRRRNLSD